MRLVMKFLLTLIIIVAVVLLGVIGFAYSGLYDVSAREWDDVYGAPSNVP